jgi:DNA-binding FrmR family transcriptional regulator
MSMPGRTNVAGEGRPKNDLVNRLGRIEGQVREITRMVEQDQYCIEILTQVAAACQALQSVALRRLDGHINHCIIDAARVEGPEQEAKLKEASDAIARLIRA